MRASNNLAKYNETEINTNILIDKNAKFHVGDESKTKVSAHLFQRNIFPPLHNKS